MFQAERYSQCKGPEAGPACRERGGRLGQRGEQETVLYSIRRDMPRSDLHFLKIISAGWRTDLREQGGKHGASKEATAIVQTRDEWGQQQGPGNGSAKCSDYESVLKTEPIARETKRIAMPFLERGKLGK